MAERVADFQAGTLKTELLFVELAMRRLREGGRAGIIVPSSVLTSRTAAAVWVRRQLLESNNLQAVVELPEGVFRPYTNVKTAVIFWGNCPPKDDVLLIRALADGYSLDDRREPVKENDLPAATQLIAGGQADVPHAWVRPQIISAEGYNLAAGRYISAGDEQPPDPGLGLFEALCSLHERLTGVGMALARVEDQL